MRFEFLNFHLNLNFFWLLFHCQCDHRNHLKPQESFRISVINKREPLTCRCTQLVAAAMTLAWTQLCVKTWWKQRWNLWKKDVVFEYEFNLKCSFGTGYTTWKSKINYACPDHFQLRILMWARTLLTGAGHMCCISLAPAARFVKYLLSR